MSSRIDAEQLAKLRAIAVERCGRQDAAHDALHLVRVLANARLIVAAERRGRADVRDDVVEAACWLHDIVQVPKGSGPAGEAARRSANEARALLTGMRVDADSVERVCHAVEAHSFSGGMRPETIEAALVQDADRLDALGAIGIARLWVTAAELGSALYHPDDPQGAGRELDDRSFGLDHIVRKLLALPATMNTESGRLEGERRAAYVAAYRERFLAELAGVSDDRGD